MTNSVVKIWAIVSDESTDLQTFAQYRLRLRVEETFLELKSNGFNNIALMQNRCSEVSSFGRLIIQA